MPDRVIRDELLRSHRYVTLSSDTCRLLFVHLILSADSLGNAEATTTSLGAAMMRPVDEATAAKLLAELADVDLIRVYIVSGKRYAHIPRFRQRLRYVRGKHPRPPANIECSEIKALLAKVGPQSDSSQTADGPQSDRGLTVVGRSEEKGREEKHKRRTQKIAYDAGARKYVGIVEADLAVWKAAYPKVDLIAELRKSVAWIESNKAKAPRSNFRRFINAWLARAAESAGAQTAEPQKWI